MFFLNYSVLFRLRFIVNSNFLEFSKLVVAKLIACHNICTSYFEVIFETDASSREIEMENPAITVITLHREAQIKCHVSKNYLTQWKSLEMNVLKALTLTVFTDSKSTILAVAPFI